MRLLWAALVLLTGVAPASAADFTGIWNLDLSKSKTTKRDDSLRIGGLGRNSDQVVSNVVLESGEKRESKIVRIYDGIERPSQGYGFGADRTEICEQIDSNTRRVTVKEAGRVVAVLTSRISADGKTMTNVWTGREPETLVYQKMELPIFLPGGIPPL